MATADKTWRPDAPGMTATLRRWIIEQSFDSNVGHIGSALSIVDIVGTLWSRVLREPASENPERDRFILAKGHAALALYSTMRYLGHLDEGLFQTYCKDGSILGVHPEHGLPGVEIATGSLGQGLSVGCGLAYALKKRGSSARVFVLLSDAECNEGQVWEAISFASHHKLDNLIAIVDLNGLQAMGATQNILDMTPMIGRWQAFGWHAVEADGHNDNALLAAFTNGIAARRGPAVVIARTVLGKGVSFMENRLEWHYRNLTPELAKKALEEVGQA